MNSLKVYYNNRLVGTIKKSEKIYFHIWWKFKKI